MSHLELLNEAGDRIGDEMSDIMPVRLCSLFDLGCSCSCCDGLHFVVAPCDCYGPGGLRQPN